MNKRGQALVVFVLLLPLIVLFVGVFINSMEGMFTKNKLDGILYDNMKIIIDKDIRDEEKIKKAIKENMNVQVNIQINEENIRIDLLAQSKGVFHLFNRDEYDIKVTYCANYVDKIITKKCD